MDNLTYGRDYPPHTFAFQIYMGSMTVLIIIFIEVGNLLTLTAAYKFRRLRRKKYILVISLAVTDALVGVSGVLLLLKFFDDCDRDNVFDLLLDVFIRIPILCSIFHLFLMGVERFVSVTWPLRFEMWVTEKVLFSGIAAAWIVSCAVSLGYLGWIPHVRKYPSCVWQTVPLKFTLILEGTLYASILLFMGVIYSKMMCIVRSHTRKIDAKFKTQSNKSERRVTFKRPLTSLFKGMKLILMLLAAYIIAWMPYFIVYFIILDYGYTTTRNIISMIVIHFGLTNSGINTVIYAWTNKDFREAYSRMLGCFKRENSEWNNSMETAVTNTNGDM